MKMFLRFLLTLYLAALSCAAYAEDPRWETSATTPESNKKIIEKNTMTDSASPAQPVMSALDIERQQKMLQLLRKPVIPLKSNDKIVRILMLPYVDEHNVLHNYEYMYVKVEEGKWIIGDYLIEPARIDRRIIKPIDNPVRNAGTTKSPSPKNSQPANTDQQNEESEVQQQRSSAHSRMNQANMAPPTQNQNGSEDKQAGEGGMSLFPEEP